MKIMVISGPENVGKSSVLVKVKEELFNKFKNNSKQCEEFQLFSNNTNESICRIWDEEHNISIGIVSYGDPDKYLEEGIKKIESKYKIDLLICASRTRGKTQEYLKNKSKNIIIIIKPYLQNKVKQLIDLINDNFAKWIIDNYYNIYKNI